ncbi:MAG: hypothetical protein KDB00_24440 [Planctomycetales bacterium]|nr:hypothetical protein [Planctomycetales bacterium]
MPVDAATMEWLSQLQWPSEECVMQANWKSGDWAVYRKSKSGATPGRRAAQVVASTKGETYRYVVDKFWVVDEVLSDGKLRLVTAKGKVHTISADDPNLRRPGLLQRFLWRERFATVEASRGHAGHHPAGPAVGA